MLEVRWLGRCGYPEALALQESIFEQRVAGNSQDTLLLLEHSPCYTAGTGTEAGEWEALEAQHLSFIVHRSSRGGRLTFHGPGQLIGYPIAAISPRSLSCFVAWLEETIIASLGTLGLEGKRVPGLRGVWVGDRKIASLGLRVRRGVVSHGFALNLSPDLGAFQAIRPCGLDADRITSVRRECGESPSSEAFAQVLGRLFFSRWPGEWED